MEKKQIRCKIEDSRGESVENQKLLFIVNLFAGKGKIRQELGEYIDYFVKNHYDVSVYTTQCVGDATDYVTQHAQAYDGVVCSGGDGTLNEVVRGMMKLPKEQRVSIGYLPTGTTNDFANSLQLPKTVKEGAKVAIHGTLQWIDMGLFNQNSFLYVAAFGIFTEVSYSTPQEIKNNLGRMAYVLEGMKSLTNIKSYTMKVFADEEEIEGNFLYGQISNSTSVGGFQAMNAQTIALDDGVFEMLLIRCPNHILDLQNIIGALLLQDLSSDWLVYRKVSRVKIQSQTPVSWTLDGEFGGECECADIENVHQAIQMHVNE